MKQATIGVWINYLTTIVFQIVFAHQFGVSRESDIYVLTFAITLALGSVFSSTAQVLATPRLVTHDGALSKGAVRTLSWIAATAIAVFAALMTVAPLLSKLLAHQTGGADATSPLRWASVFMMAQVLAVEASCIHIALGRRFIAAAGPSFPSIFATVYIVFFASTANAADTLAAGATGVLVEIVVLALTAPRRGVRDEAEWTPIGTLIPATAAQLGLLSLLPLADRLYAGLKGADGAAEWNYSIRSLAIAQQLIVGGVVLAGLGAWAAVALSDRRAMQRDVSRTARVAAMALSAAGAVGLAGAHLLVQLVYQRGAFTADDTDHVATLLQLSAVGFAAEGVSLVLSQGLLAGRENWIAIRLGMINVALRVTLGLVLGLGFGARGAAVAYSAASVLILAVTCRQTYRRHILESRGWAPVATFAAAVWLAALVALLVTQGSSAAAMACVLAVAAIAMSSRAVREVLGQVRSRGSVDKPASAT